MRDLELKIPPLVLVVICALDMWLLSWIFSFWSFTVANLWIVLSFAIGTLFAFFGVVEFKRKQTTVNPMHPEETSQIVATGVYRLTRNPMYLGMLLWLLACGLYLGSWVGLLMLPIFVAYMTQFQIKPEERQLKFLFGDEYRRYQQRVRRWL
ncbi:MAG: isoprenylcysteine carboxylmethyltransferase family protein [Aliidiomarina sp.]|uniref:methyltransferase family protein n=1 Tax=Aliidiomarina sp. TaxID=1872439 RepID=UPI0025B9984A|nr:isoprenylcysteine carboxylmethyltransferase family protein [Aliidiomarina sp.]MCH8502144.1 isoprenylcysteine carboxylmethyltransferase family protein [Aliidiomarina sp.]